MNDCIDESDEKFCRQDGDVIPGRHDYYNQQVKLFHLRRLDNSELFNRFRRFPWNLENLVGAVFQAE